MERTLETVRYCIEVCTKTNTVFIIEHLILWNIVHYQLVAFFGTEFVNGLAKTNGYEKDLSMDRPRMDGA